MSAKPGMMRSLINDPDHWRQRAAKARGIAEEISDQDARQTMLRIAEGYDRLVQRAEERLLTLKRDVP